MAAPAPNSNDILGQARFSAAPGGSSSSAYDAPTAAGILSGGIDPSALHPLAGLVDNKDLDYLLLDDDKISGVDGGKSVLPSRGWGDELCYGTGATYLAGLSLGGLWGLREGLRKPILPTKAAAAATAVASTSAAPAAATAATATATAPAASAVGAQATAFAKDAAAAATQGAAVTPAEGARAAPRVSARLRWNNILNQVTRRGSFAGNSAGVLALMYNGFNSTFDSVRGKHDIYGSMTAGALTGLLWRCTAGVKPMITASVALTAGAAAWTGAKAQLL